MKIKFNHLVLLAVLFGLLMVGPAQAATSIFTFTSSINPVDPYQEVTFTVSAPFGDPTNPLFGYVDFFDNGTAIFGCSTIPLNFPGNIPTPDTPAECATIFTTSGVHSITASFTSMNTPAYNDETIVLPSGQTVNDFHPLTFTPTTLPDGIYGTGYSQELTAVCSEGVTCGDVTWNIAGSLPTGMSFAGYYNSNTALLSGAPETIGVYTFEVTGNDHAGSLGSRTYTWNVLKATPKFTEFDMDIIDGWIKLEVYITHPQVGAPSQPSGSASFSIDGVPVAACSGDNAISVSNGAVTSCYKPAPAGLAPGSHTVQVGFVPDAASSPNYNSSSGTFTLTVPATISGLLFNDLNQDGTQDTGEEQAGYALQVDLDQGCDGSSERSVFSSPSTGQFSISGVTPGLQYCLGVPDYGNWRQTTTLAPFTVNGDISFDIGIYETVLIFSPDPLPNASVGELYSQTIAISGGTAPYSVLSVDDQYLPDGMSFDQTTLVLSGAPTAGGMGGLSIEVQDANGFTGKRELMFYIQADGSFNLTSSNNPSASGQAVTFTFTGSGDVVINMYGSDPIPPFGLVDFYDGESLITDCSAIPLNFEGTGTQDLPAVCTTSALSDGSHEIKASFTPYPGFEIYHAATKGLVQQVGTQKETPNVTVKANETIHWNQPFNIMAEVTSPSNNLLLDGTVAFYIDDQPVPGCEAVPMESTVSYYPCTNVSMDLAVGTHTLRADYTPTAVFADSFTSGSGSTEFTVQSSYFVVQGHIFEDKDQDGLYDSSIDSRLYETGWPLTLDENCDKEVDYTTTTDAGGNFYFIDVPSGGQSYCLAVTEGPGYKQTTTLDTFVLTENKFVQIGFYYPTITISQIGLSGVNLPDGTVGQEYSQSFSASGGTGPYEYSFYESEASIPPAGLTLSPVGVLSGTPTTATNYSFVIQAKDINGAIGRTWFFLNVKAPKVDGFFNFTSSSNPSILGEEVTFTVSATGDLVNPDIGPIPPLGLVTFYADGTPIDSCSNLFLNLFFEENSDPLVGDYPVTCSVATLDTGAHEITATYIDYSGYNEPTLTLTQQVGTASNTAPLADAGGPYLAAVNTAITFDGRLSSDPDGDSLTYAWDFGDGTTINAEMPSHAYAAVDIYDVCLTVNDGLVDSMPACTLVVIYDPSAGFVTGSGWIDSPAGAYIEDQTLTDKATFAFMSKYKKGASAPDGSTEFQFKTGGFNFYSTSYDWLLISKKVLTAQFKGSGTVNGAMDPNGNAYKFMLWAGDSSPDTFRIRIWWEGADGVEQVVYDNGSDQAIGAGNIVVHAGK